MSDDYYLFMDGVFLSVLMFLSLRGVVGIILALSLMGFISGYCPRAFRMSE